MKEQADFYSILGVLPDAEAVVIVAAYRALASRYHPDRWQGPAEVAHARMADINRAYETLGNPESRQAYDKQRTNAHPDFDDASDEASKAFDEALQAVEQRWDLAAGVLPNLQAIRTRLERTSHQLAFAFVTVLLETKRFRDADVLASSMEMSFLQRHFGTDEKIIAFAQELISLGMRDAIRALNRLVDVLGSEIAPHLVMNKISKEFAVEKFRQDRKNAEAAEASQREKQAKAQRETRNRSDRIAMLRERLESQPYVSLAKELAELLGFSVSVTEKGWLRGSEFELSRQGQVAHRFTSENAFVEWARQNLFRD
ncbi:J domain-containing protein [Caenimonas sp. SL110]|uniref:J domain-containing protein n=1 Tax=Caenimonas sp. SL110 TaxID=1450524 RepID=UPI00069E7EEA|nr:DnaJ domain-containing protein [Caenimonas sp. SL110]